MRTSYVPRSNTDTSVHAKTDRSALATVVRLNPVISKLESPNIGQ